MANYLIIPESKKGQLFTKLAHWFGIRPIETNDNRYVIPVKALKDAREVVIHTLKDQISKDRLIELRDYLLTRTIVSDQDIEFKTYEDLL
jgi:hypothetical protein